ncbi:WEB family protein [Pyrus ussuriensis x Pyrus communis]|uniref:WEB family protein n=1 Tax=Pyrus ussuriensis x Pyrus communis TaxID=2448454 RepID=A0A5N5FL78_9ROSA|nr:WEB family protein [Pyrus ussuriensis x Pyrus communis]
MTCDAKNLALAHADDATKIVEIHANKLRALLDAKLETEASESSKVSLISEVDYLKQELEKSKESAKMAESYARSVVEERKIRVEQLEMQVEEANKLERSASESLDSVMKQLEGNIELLHDAESEIFAHKGKVRLLEITIGRHIGDLEDQNFLSHLSLTCHIQYQTLLEEKNKLINDLENPRDKKEKSKKAMERLASALHEVSTEARKAKEKLLSNQAEYESNELQIEDLKMVLKATNEKYEGMLDDAKHEMYLVTSNLEQCKIEFKIAKADWEEKELHLANCVKHSEEEISLKEKEINRLLNLLTKSNEEACALKDGEAQLKDSLKEVEYETFQCIVNEKDELRDKEAASIENIEESSRLLEEGVADKRGKENGELADSEIDYDLPPRVVDMKRMGMEDKRNQEWSLHQVHEENSREENNNVVSNGKAEES